MKPSNRRRLQRAAESVHNEWVEAPWFVILIVLITALVGPGILWALWRYLAGALF